VVLRDADGYPFAVGTIDGQVIIQVAATAPRGTVRLSAEHASGLALKLIEAAARVMRADPAALLMFEGGRRYELRATLAYDRKEPYEVRLLFPPGLEHLDLVLARELLDQGLIGPATFGGIRVWPVHGGRWTVCIGLVTPAGDTRFEAPATTVQEAGGARPGQGAGRGAHPEHPTGAAAPRDAARTGTRRPRPHRRGRSDRGPPRGPRRHRPRRAGRLSALQVHRQARRMPLPRLRAVPLLQPARQQRLRVLPCRAPRPHLRPPAGTPGKSGQVAQTNQATPEHPRSGVFASERCQT
jgi:Streptomyces sporulation and cell division protein, SsgA